MDDIARFDPNDRSDLFRAAAEARGVTAGIIEKDFWVCWVLRRLYSAEHLPAHIYFKGGTSLSKVFGVIERMSEDIDLVIDRRALGFSGAKDPAEPGLSSKARQRLIKEIQETSRELVRDVLQPRLKDSFAEALGMEAGAATWDVALAHDDPDEHTLLLAYPTIEPHSEYWRPVVRLELGARGDPWPAVSGAVRPYAADVFAEHFRKPDTHIPRVVAPERTFWEKATLLHMLHHRPRNEPWGSRLARHYYDVYRLAHHDLGKNALACLELLQSVVAHKRLFFHSKKARYELAVPGSLRLLPPENRVEELRVDYARMAEEMMFGQIPDVEEVLEGLRETENAINEHAGT